MHRFGTQGLLMWCRLDLRWMRRRHWMASICVIGKDARSRSVTCYSIHTLFVAESECVEVALAVSLQVDAAEDDQTFVVGLGAGLGDHGV